MKKITPPKVRLLASGIELEAKQMQSKAGDLLPKHLANVESILFIHEGEVILHIHDEDKILKSGEAFIIPAETIHQIEVVVDFKGLHFMPKNIKFKFFN
ncbi:MAG TPA: cupin domain-containing protein [Pedobacter sp.]|nr:cupin domain-containing protein [Pedobacter sp.]